MLVFLLGWFLLPHAQAWENHRAIARASLQAYENWEPAVFEPIEKVLPALSVNGAKAPENIKEFAAQLGIHDDKITWDWQPPMVGENAPTTLEVLLQAVREPDDGMDQNLTLTPDQKYMGGFEGPSSQGVRHMYYRAWSPAAPLVTFHIPLHEMGFAPERAELFFNLARQAKFASHPFWAHRFLGWGLHYVQDIGQPYHSTQFASFRLLPLNILMSVGWVPFMIETKHVVANFHLAFERYTDFMMSSEDSPVLLAFKVPSADEDLKYTLEQKADLPIKAGVERLAVASSLLAAPLAASQIQLMGKTLRDPKVDLESGFQDASGKAKVDFPAIEADEKLKSPRMTLRETAVQAISNTGVATRWYVDRFRAATR